MKAKYMVAAVLVTLAFTILQGLISLLTQDPFEFTDYLWNLVAKLLIVAIMGYYVVNNFYQSHKLWVFTFIILYVIGNFNINIEALIFNVTDPWETINMLLIGIPVSLAEAFILTYLFGRWKTDAISRPKFAPRKVDHWIGRILAGNFLYFLFYVLAGMMMQWLTPRFTEFYADKVPPIMTIIVTNMFFRGFVFVGIAILIDRTVNGKVWAKAVLVGLIFAIVGGIAPLIPPNEYMPSFIRVAHGVEVGISNFLYGFTVLFIVRSRAY